MFSIIGLLRKPASHTTEELRTWRVGSSYASKVLERPGLGDHRLWTIEESLEQESLAFTSEKPYDGRAAITFDSKEAFESAIASPKGKNDNESFNEGAPDCLVLASSRDIFRDAALDVLRPNSVRN